MANTTNFNWETPDDTDLVKDGAAAIRTLGSAIDTSLVDLKGGTTGQILSKATNTDMDFTWITNDVGDITAVNVSSPITGGGTSGAVTISIQDGTTAQKGAVQLENSTSSTSTTTAAVPASVKSAYDLADGAIAKSLVDAKGDLIVGTADNTVARLASSASNGNVLTVDTSTASGLKWAAPASGSTFAGCYVYTTTITSVANDTYVKIPFNAEEYDTNGYHDNSTNNTRMTIPSGKGGYYQVNVTTQWGTFAESLCRIAIYVNNAIVSQNSITKTSSFRGFYTRQSILNLAVGDYLEIAVMQGSGSTQDLWGDDSAPRSTACSIGLLGA